MCTIENSSEHRLDWLDYVWFGWLGYVRNKKIDDPLKNGNIYQLQIWCNYWAQGALSNKYSTDDIDALKQLYAYIRREVIYDFRVAEIGLTLFYLGVFIWLFYLGGHICPTHKIHVIVF